MIDRSSTRATIRTLPIRHDSSSPVHERGAPRSLDGLPLLLTVGEAAEVLRISRATAYKLVEVHRSTGGQTGLPHVRLGSRALVRRVDLAAITGWQSDAP